MTRARSMMRVPIFCQILLLFCLGCTQEKPGVDSINASAQVREAVAANAAQASGNLSVTIFPREPDKDVSLRGQVQGADKTAEWQWYRNGNLLPDQTGSILPRHGAVRGDRITVLVRAGGQEATDSVIVGNSPPEVASVGLETTQIFRGRDIVALPEASDPDGDLVDFRFVWFIDGDEVLDHTSATLPGGAFRKGNSIALQVIPSDGQGEGRPYMSAPFIVPNGPPGIISQPPKQFSGFEYSYQATAEDPDGDQLVFALESGPEGMLMDEESGLVSWGLSGAPIGEHEVTISVTDVEGLWARQVFTLQVGQ